MSIYPVGMDSFGADVYYAVPASTLTWIEIANVVSITPPNPTIKKIDVTNINQGDSTLRSIPGATDPGTVVVECIYTAANYQTLLAIVQTADSGGGYGTVNWKILMPDGMYFSFTGFILKMELSQLSEQDKAVTIKVDIQIAAYITNVE